MSENDINIIKGPSVPTPFPGAKCLAKIIFEFLRLKNSDEIIMTNGVTGEQITYGKLHQSSINLANNLKNLGITRGDTVAIISENNWKFVATTLSCFYLGASAALLNPDYMPGELQHFFALANPRLVFCTRQTESNILTLKHQDLYSGMVLNFDSKDLFNFEDLGDFELAETDPDDVAVILTSSGTSGVPKGVMISCENFLHALHYTSDPNSLNFNEKGTMIAFLPFFHMFGFMLAIGSVIFGARLIILSKFKPDIFFKIIQDYKVTILGAVPPILQFLIKTPLLDKYDISSIKEIMCGAAKITKELEEMVEQRLYIPLRQVYGLTESTGVATLMPRHVKKPGSVGQVVMNCKSKICDPETGKSLGPNRVGEFRFKGPGLMLGYIDNEEQTKEAVDEDGYLKTGDLGYYDEDHFFYIVDRLKEVIKCKGFQVSPAELETLLIKHRSVKDAGVVGIPDDRAGEVPLAFVVRQSDNVSEEGLIKYVEDNISVQKRLYGGVKFVKEIPRSPTGKILRRKLKELL